MLALIDGDIVVHRVGFTTENDDESIANWRACDMLEGILDQVNADEYRVFLTKANDEVAFRKLIYPEYKANRKSPKPKNYESIRKFLIDEWTAEVINVLEADDALAIEQCNSEDSIICSIDKDLLQIPGQHFNFVKNEIMEVSYSDGLRRFYTQLLTGDPSDNIKGLSGIGIKKAEKILGDSYEESDLFNKVREAYGNDEEMLLNGRCLWIWRTPKDDWKTHFGRLSETNNERKQSSTDTTS